MEHAVAGVAAGAFGTLLGYPMEVVKTTMQAGNQASAFGTVRQILQSDGLGGLYRGVALPLAALTVLNAQTFAMHNFISAQLQKQGTPQPIVPALAGACCAPFASLISTPLELLKVRIALRVEPNTLAALRAAWRNGIYVGHGVNTVREAVFLGAYFGVYHRVKQSFTPPGSQTPAYGVAVSGGAAGAAGWLLSFPFDCVKTHLQKAVSEKRQTAIQTARQLIRDRGFLGLYRGMGPSIARACVVSSSRFGVYELVLGALRSEGAEPPR
ncbi:mitochondrial carrier domain-containing protein [Pelagophyceae sp. CCMP2097]|nr:mitochondrial carrier domain-containing protein [Pelagophyceae sp. CCMP2097]